MNVCIKTVTVQASAIQPRPARRTISTGFISKGGEGLHSVNGVLNSRRVGGAALALLTNETMYICLLPEILFDAAAVKICPIGSSTEQLCFLRDLLNIGRITMIVQSPAQCV